MNEILEKRSFEENTFEASDGEKIYYKKWPASIENPDKAIVFFHRGHEHSGRCQHLVDELNMSEIPMFAWDARGHGKTGGKRGYSPSIGRTILDIDEFIRNISETNNIPVENIIVIGQSVGAVTTLAWVHDYAPKIRGIIAASPAFDIKLYVPFAKELIAMKQKLCGQFFVNSYVNSSLLTHDKERAESYNKDELIARPIASHILLDLYKVAERVIADAHAIKTPLQLFVSNDDCVVNTEPEHKFYENCGSLIKEKYILDGFYHDTLGEKERHIVIEKIQKFVNKLYSMPVYKHDYSNADIWGKTADTLRELQAEPSCCCKKTFYKIAPFFMKTIGRISDGINLGVETGFDSGSTLDYVYQNKPSGKCLVGKIMDREYLNSPGWAGIRERKVNIQKMIIEAVYRLNKEGKQVKILDIAAGHGRYILDAIEQAENVENILLRDYSKLNVEKGSKLIEERGLSEKAKFVEGNAFDKDSIATVEPQPTLGIVSGLYELFPDNSLLRDSLAGLAQAIPQGGYLIYTNQPWHPQLEFIARALTSHRDGISWAMRCRTQGEMDSLVEEAGFVKIKQYCDENDIFSVSLAQKL